MQHITNQPINPWHYLSYGSDAPEIVCSIIEITQGSKAKYELDKETGFLRLDRVLASTLHYPFHYGFIPQTYCLDRDPLDIMILCSENLIPLSIVEARVLGCLKMHDQGEQDDKIIAVAQHDPFMAHVKELSDLDPQSVRTIQYFFQEYKKPEGKLVEIEALLDRKQAYQVIKQAIDLYKTTFKK